MRRDSAGDYGSRHSTAPIYTRRSCSSGAVLKTLYPDLEKRPMAAPYVLQRIPKRVPASVHRILSTTSVGSTTTLSDKSYEHFKTLAVTKPASAVFQVRPWVREEQQTRSNRCTCGHFLLQSTPRALRTGRCQHVI